jgi:nitrite reductase/ring-hydroxylating ferredoxin subunit
MDRRGFIKDACSLCVALGSGLIIGSLSSCSSLPVFDTDVVEKRIRVPIAAFGTREVLVVRVRSLMYDLAIHRKEDNTYAAVLLRCSHADTQLTATGEEYTCSEHGSRFDLDGRVRKGPALKDLIQFPAERVDGNVIVPLPESVLR